MRQLVSVILPNLNGGRYLGQAIESVLRQESGPLELIVSDDGSTDDSAAIARSFGDDVRYMPHEHCGLPGSLNHGLQAARGTLIAFIDHDDLWTPGRLAHQRRLLDRHPECMVVLGTLQRFVESDRAGTTVRRFVPERQRSMQLGTGLYRRSVFDQVGHFNAGYQIGNDADWFMRAQDAGVRIHLDEDVALLYRRHDANMTNEPVVADRALLTVLKHTLDRRRASKTQAP